MTSRSAESFPPRPHERIGDCFAGLVVCLALAIAPLSRLPGTDWSGRRDTPQPAPIRPLVLDPNVCHRDELQLLPRVGPSLAARIDRERRRFPFHEPTDLLRVRGIGPATLAGVRPYVRFGPSR